MNKFGSFRGFFGLILLIFAHNDKRFLDPGMLLKHVFDLSQFDAIAA